MLFSSYSSIAFYFYPRPPRGGRPLFGRGGNVALHISIHALREEGDPWKIRRPPTRHTFLSTPSARRATVALGQGQAEVHHFYPRPPRGGRPTTSTLSQFFARFLSTPSARRATKNLAVRHLLLDDFYPRPPRGGRRWTAMAKSSPSRFLSTPSARRATSSFRYPYRWKVYFYPRPPRGGRRYLLNQIDNCPLISIHALREEGDVRFCQAVIR